MAEGILGSKICCPLLAFSSGLTVLCGLVQKPLNTGSLSEGRQTKNGVIKISESQLRKNKIKTKLKMTEKQT